jgi:hypothetical protein
VNDLLTPLAVVGIIAFVIAVVLIAVLYLREAVSVVRLFRNGRISVRLTRGSTIPNSPTRRPEPGEPAALAEQLDPPSDASSGWGFDPR